jgi:hypothetical protein
MVDNFVVSDRKSFIEFLELLTKELGHSPEKWENKTLEDFLGAMARYADDIQGYYNKVRPREGINADTPHLGEHLQTFYVEQEFTSDAHYRQQKL